MRIGVAIGEDTFAASWSGSTWETNLCDGPTVDAIRDACSEVNRLVQSDKSVSASVALLPPLIQMRRIELPRMNEDDYRLAVTTNARRYFSSFGEPAVCGVAATGARKRGVNVPLIAFAASSELLENVSIGLANAGWAINRIVPGQAALCSSVMHEHPSARRGLASIAVRLPREVDVLEIDAGCLNRVRRCRRAAEFPPAEHGRQLFTLGIDGGDQSVAMVAATAAELPRHFEIVPESLRRVRATRQRRISALVVALVGVNLLGAAIAYRWRLERQLANIVARRSAIQLTVKQAIASRDSTEHLVERIRSIAGLEETAPRWSAVLSRIVIGLPEDAKLSSIRAEPDSVTVDGQAQDASRVLSALKKTPGVTATRSTSPILRESVADRIAVERWHFAMRVDHHAAARP